MVRATVDGPDKAIGCEQREDQGGGIEYSGSGPRFLWNGCHGYGRRILGAPNTSYVVRIIDMRQDGITTAC